MIDEDGQEQKLTAELATDLKSVYPDKDITLIHSRTRLLPIYPIEMHDGSEYQNSLRSSAQSSLMSVVEHLKLLGIKLILGERVLTWPENPDTLHDHLKILETSSGRVLSADLVLPCTGQKPQTLLMAQCSPSSISTTTGRIKVHPTMQVDNSDEMGHRDADMRHVFACGDSAETGSIQAGHTAYYQGQVAAANIAKLVVAQEEGAKAEVELESYVVSDPAIKVTLGLVSIYLQPPPFCLDDDSREIDIRPRE